MIRQPDYWWKAKRDSYIFAGVCKKCGLSKPINKYGHCEFCDKVMPDVTEYKDQEDK